MKANMKDTNPGIGYGLTETNALAANNTGDVYLQKPDSTGFAVPKLIDLKIVDDDGNELPTGEIGEVCIRGAVLFVVIGKIRKLQMKCSIPKDGFVRRRWIIGRG